MERAEAENISNNYLDEQVDEVEEYVDDELAQEIEEEMNRYKDMPLPAVISLPGQGGSTGYGMNNIRSAVERAVGADILFKE
jgi:vacuolar-type H+-ATPase subunit F/Vma7